MHENGGFFSFYTRPGHSADRLLLHYLLTESGSHQKTAKQSAELARSAIKMDDDLLELYNERNGLGDVMTLFSSAVIRQSGKQPHVLPVEADHEHGSGHLVHLGLEAVRGTLQVK